MTMRLRTGWILIATLVGTGPASCQAAWAREPSVTRERLTEAQVVGVVPVPGGEGAAVALAIGDSNRVVPIFIGAVEAAAIARARLGVRPPRPQTHDLLADVIAALDGQLRQVVIDDLREGIYFATVQIRAEGGRLVWVDARPSDALALAVRQGSPILLGPAVVASAPDPDQLPQAPARFIETLRSL